MCCECVYTYSEISTGVITDELLSIWYRKVHFDTLNLSRSTFTFLTLSHFVSIHKIPWTVAAESVEWKFRELQIPT